MTSYVVGITLQHRNVFQEIMQNVTEHILAVYMQYFECNPYFPSTSPSGNNIFVMCAAPVECRHIAGNL
jgi:hypothetical protein